MRQDYLLVPLPLLLELPLLGIESWVVEEPEDSRLVPEAPVAMPLVCGTVPDTPVSVVVPREALADSGAGATLVEAWPESPRAEPLLPLVLPLVLLEPVPVVPLMPVLAGPLVLELLVLGLLELELEPEVLEPDLPVELQAARAQAMATARRVLFISISPLHVGMRRGAYCRGTGGRKCANGKVPANS